ncbi:9487_t:CDS:2, partial [Racocetra fulgida]
MCVPDRMHHAGLGLFKYQLQFTVKLLILRYGNGPIKNLEEHLSRIPRHPNLKVFKNGFDKFKQLTAAEYRDLMKIDIENETILIKAFEHAYLDNDYKVIIRTSSSYYGQKAFSDVCVEMDESEQNDYLTDGGLCYTK